MRVNTTEATKKMMTMTDSQCELYGYCLTFYKEHFDGVCCKRPDNILYTKKVRIKRRLRSKQYENIQIVYNIKINGNEQNIIIFKRYIVCLNSRWFVCFFSFIHRHCILSDYCEQINWHYFQKNIFRSVYFFGACVKQMHNFSENMTILLSLSQCESQYCAKISSCNKVYRYTYIDSYTIYER